MKISVRPEIPDGMTVFTSTLAGATLTQLLTRAATNTWPDNTCVDEWALLRNWAIQLETLIVDEIDADTWAQQMDDLAAQALPYPEYVAQRCALLATRSKARKLAQWRLRDKYGFARHRRWGLISRDILAFHAQWMQRTQSAAEPQTARTRVAHSHARASV